MNNDLANGFSYYYLSGTFLKTDAADGHSY